MRLAEGKPAAVAPAATRPAAALRHAILALHRWLGIAGGLLFLLWFASGIVMIYARMPSVDPGERLRRMPDLDLSTARISPLDAAAAFDIERPDRLRIGMLGARPVYRFAAGETWTAVFADDGARVAGLTTAEAMRLARRLHPEHAATARHDGRIGEPDQWTLQSRAFLPAHRIALGDANETRVYLSEQTGEVVMTTARAERRWAYLGPVPHWLYFTPLRRHGTAWSRTVIVLSSAGCLLALSGLVAGVWQAARATLVPGDGSGLARGAARRDSAQEERRRGGRRRWGPVVPTPYGGWMRWHHYAGLAFGLFTFTWILSGCLSMEPLAWHPGTAPTVEQRTAAAGGALRLAALTLDRVRAVQAVLATAFSVKELELVQLRSEPYLIGYRAPAVDETTATRGPGYEPSFFLSEALPFEHRLASVQHPERGALTRFDDESIVEAARAAVPRARLLDAVWLDDYDAYYYDRTRRAPLPVLRARFDDAARTWLYLDPHRGLILRKEERLTRWNRWLYHGLHSLDFPFLHHRRPLWDVVVIVLCLGGILVASTSITDGWRRVGRLLRRVGRSSS